MNCPFCGKEMQEGTVPAAQNALKWCSKGMSIQEIYLTNTPVFQTQEAQAFYCPDCQQVIVPVPELQSLSKKMKKDFDRTVEKITSATQELEERREERQNERNTVKRKGKDPWEL